MGLAENHPQVVDIHLFLAFINDDLQKSHMLTQIVHLKHAQTQWILSFPDADMREFVH